MLKSFFNARLPNLSFELESLMLSKGCRSYAVVFQDLKDLWSYPDGLYYTLLPLPL